MRKSIVDKKRAEEEVCWRGDHRQCRWQTAKQRDDAKRGGGECRRRPDERQINDRGHFLRA